MNNEEMLYCEKCDTNFHSSNPCHNPENEDEVVCGDCWTIINKEL